MHPWTERFTRLDAGRLPSPCFVVDEAAVEENLELLHKVQKHLLELVRIDAPIKRWVHLRPPLRGDPWPLDDVVDGEALGNAG